MRPTTFVRSAFAVLLVAVVLIGPPLAFWAFRTVFLPDHLPTWTEVSSWFLERDSGSIFLGILVLAAVVAWIQLVIALIVELLAILRGVAAPRLRGFGWAQRIAAAVLLTVLSGTAAEAAQPAPPPAVSAPPRAPHGYTVMPGDSLIRIATQRLGDAQHYREIFDLNHGHPQPDGDALRDPGQLKPGWILTLPDDPRPALSPDADGPCNDVVVKPGDSLSKIAQEHLGAASRYREIFDLNRDRAQPDGRTLQDPNHIHPGMVLHLPAPATNPAGGGGGAARSEVTAGGTGGPDCAPPPAPPPRTSTSPGRSAPQVVPAPRPEVPRQATGPAVADSDTIPWGTIGVGGFLAAGLLAALATRRAVARRRRRPGQRMSRPPQFNDVETTLRKVEQPATVDTLDHALRALANHYDQQNSALPAVRAVVVGANGIRLQLAAASPPSASFFVPGITDTEWLLDITGMPSAADVAAVPPPYPALTSLGHNDDGDLVLVNLDQAGWLDLDGESADVEAVLLAMAWDLAVASWAENLTVTLVATGETTAACHPKRLRYAATLDDALRTVNDGATAKGHASAVEIILSTVPPTHDELDRLHTATAVEAPKRRLAALVAAADSQRDHPGAWHLDVSAPSAHLGPLATDVKLQRLSAKQVADLVDTFTAAAEPRFTTARAYRNVPSEPATVDDDIPSTAATAELPTDAGEVTGPQLRLLGPVELCNVDPDAVETKKINRLTELAAFLALHPGTNADEISRQLGTATQPWSATTRQGYISRLRTWLGRNDEGELLVPNIDAKHGYRLAGGFEVDWHRFKQLARLGFDDESERRREHLQKALDLVTGMPFSNIPRSRYAWSSWFQRDMIDAIVDVAHTLACDHQKIGDFAAARRAVARGLQAESSSEILYRDLLRVEFRAGNPGSVKKIADKLADLAAALDVELDDETTTLVRDLLTSHQSRRPR